MDVATQAVIRRWAEENEAALRASFDGDDPFPAEWDRDLAALPRETIAQEALRYARIKHYYWLRFDELNAKSEAAPEDAAAAARALLRREPVMVKLAGRRVAVTGRSYNALAELAAHQLRISELHVALAHIESLHRTTLIRFAGVFRRRRVRRRLALLGRVQRQVYAELLAHRRALYAHALTADGAPAADVRAGHPAPWWTETSFEDDAQLLAALVEVGPLRYQKLGEAARPKDRRAAGFTEDFGFHSLLTWVEGKRQMPPAALYDQDVGQILASIRAGSLSSAEIDGEV